MASEDSRDLKSSRLGQMQMRFQQRTQQEQELRRRELGATRTKGEGLATGAPSAASTRIIGNGKVRQMFDERRRGAGIDRSNPLKPIGTLPSPPAQAKTRTQQITKGISSMSLKEVGTRRTVVNDSNNNKFATQRTVINRTLKPVVTRKTPPAQEPVASRRSESTPQPSAQKMRTTNRVPGGNAQPVVNRKSPPSIRKIDPKSPVKHVKMEVKAPPPDGTVLCRFCGRHFNSDRVQKHEAVCQKTQSTKRKIFDASKQRALGTEAETFTKRSKGLRLQTSYSSAAQQKGLTTGVKKSNWRKKHEEFIQSIRAAKQVQAHLARGGNIRDLPPPPPSENPDYIQCPHCQRRFNQQAAERHIPKCASMIHNKPRANGPPLVKKR